MRGVAPSTISGLRELYPAHVIDRWLCKPYRQDRETFLRLTLQVIRRANELGREPSQVDVARALRRHPGQVSRDVRELIRRGQVSREMRLVPGPTPRQRRYHLRAL